MLSIIIRAKAAKHHESTSLKELSSHLPGRRGERWQREIFGLKHARFQPAPDRERNRRLQFALGLLP